MVCFLISVALRRPKTLGVVAELLIIQRNIVAMPIICTYKKRAADNILIVKAAVSGQAVQLTFIVTIEVTAQLRQGKKFNGAVHQLLHRPIIIFNLLEQRLPMERLVAMVQKEVAERMVAKPGGKDYGALSVSIQYYTEPEIAFIVPPESFIPAPNVDSAVIVCKRRTVPPVEVCDEKLFFKVVKAAFSVRRKMLSNALKNMGISSVQAAAWLERAGIDPKRRGETLSLADFASLTNCFKEVLAETEQ